MDASRTRRWDPKFTAVVKAPTGKIKYMASAWPKWCKLSNGTATLSSGKRMVKIGSRVQSRTQSIDAMLVIVCKSPFQAGREGCGSTWSLNRYRTWDWGVLKRVDPLSSVWIRLAPNTSGGTALSSRRKKSVFVDSHDPRVLRFCDREFLLCIAIPDDTVMNGRIRHITNDRLAMPPMLLRCSLATGEISVCYDEDFSKFVFMLLRTRLKRPGTFLLWVYHALSGIRNEAEFLLIDVTK
jgi:hypothetical protein